MFAAANMAGDFPKSIYAHEDIRPENLRAIFSRLLEDARSVPRCSTKEVAGFRDQENLDEIVKIVREDRPLTLKETRRLMNAGVWYPEMLSRAFLDNGERLSEVCGGNSTGHQLCINQDGEMLYRYVNARSEDGAKNQWEKLPPAEAAMASIIRANIYLYLSSRPECKESIALSKNSLSKLLTTRLGHLELLFIARAAYTIGAALKISASSSGDSMCDIMSYIATLEQAEAWSWLACFLMDALGDRDEFFLFQLSTLGICFNSCPSSPQTKRLLGEVQQWLNSSPMNHPLRKVAERLISHSKTVAQ